MIKLPLTQEQVQRYQRWTGKPEIRTRVVIDFGAKPGARECAEGIVAGVFGMGVENASVETEKVTFGLRERVMVVLEGRGSRVALAVLTINDGFNDAQATIAGA